MVCKTAEFKFDPDKTALENLFALIYRTNHVRLDPTTVEVDIPQAIEPDEHGDNTIIVVKGREGGPWKGQGDLYYARADIATHYPTFTLDLKDVMDIHDKDALIAYLDGRFNLVDGEFDIDINDPFTSLFQFVDVDIFAKDESLIYIGQKKIHLYWSEGIRRITDEGQLRITEDGQIRVIHLDDLD